MADEMSTPINTVSRENLTVLIMNNMLNTSVEFASDCDTVNHVTKVQKKGRSTCKTLVMGSCLQMLKMETDSPHRKPLTQPNSKKLFHSPMTETDSPTEPSYKRPNRSKKAKKRKQNLIPNSSEKIKRAYVKECEQDGYSPDVGGGMRKRVLISLFHNKEYSMDVS